MSEEEKKAIEILKKLQKKTPYIIWGDGTPYNKSNQIQTILNLIDNQQKEIQRLEKGNRSLMESRIKWKNRYYKEKEKEQNLMFQLKDEEKELIEVTQNIISKDKIREFIKEELPDDELMKWNVIYDVNGIDLRIKLEKMLEENDE